MSLDRFTSEDESFEIAMQETKPPVTEIDEPNGVIEELNSADLNQLLKQQITSPELKECLVESNILTFKNNNKGYADIRGLTYFAIEKKYSEDEKSESTKRLVFFEVMKDVDTPENHPYLYAIWNLLNLTKIDKDEKKETIDFLNREREKNSIFIIPVEQCDGLFGLSPEVFNKGHIQLAIYKTATRELTVYDSQGMIPFLDRLINITLPSFAYSDKYAAEAIKFNYHYKGSELLNIQKHSHLCGYFVNTLRRFFLEDGNDRRFREICLSPENIISKKFYFKNHLNITNTLIEKTKENWIYVYIDQGSGDVKEEDEKKMDVGIIPERVSTAAPVLFSPKARVDNVTAAQGGEVSKTIQLK